jgi:hypothetical protein
MKRRYRVGQILSSGYDAIRAMADGCGVSRQDGNGIDLDVNYIAYDNILGGFQYVFKEENAPHAYFRFYRDDLDAEDWYIVCLPELTYKNKKSCSDDSDIRTILEQHGKVLYALSHRIQEMERRHGAGRR